MPDPTGRISHLPDFHRGVSWKQPVRVASTANVTLVSGLENGDTIDGITLATGDRVLLKNQTAGAENGIWVVAASGLPTRAYDMDQDASSAVPASEALGAVVIVLAGTVNAGTIWRCTNTTAPTLGTTALTFGAITTAGGGGSYVVNVMDYGAVEDFATDNAAAFAAAVAAMTPGCTLVFPSITGLGYKTSATIAIVQRGCLITGTGSEYGTRIHMTTANTTLLSSIPTALDGTRNQTNLIRSLLLTGPGGASSGRGVYASSDVHLENVGVAGFYDGIYWDSVTYYSRAFGCFVTDCDHAGFVLNETNNITIDTCRISGDFGGGGLIGALAYGVFIASADPRGGSLRVVNSSIEYFTADGIWVDGAQDLLISGNWFESSQSSSGHAYINLGPGGSNFVLAALLDTNHLVGPGVAGFQGIKCGRVANLTVIGCDDIVAFGALSVVISSTANSSKFTLINNSFGAGTITLPAGSIRIQPATTITPSAVANAAAVGSGPDLAFGDHVHALGGTAGGDLSGTYPNPSVVDDSHSHTAATLPGGGGIGEILISDTPAGSPLVFADLIQNEAQTDLVYADP